MAELLPPIHAIQPGTVRVQPWQIWDDLRKMSPPTWSARKHDWERLIDIVQPTNKTIDALNKLSLPAGVDIKIKASPSGA